MFSTRLFSTDNTPHKKDSLKLVRTGVLHGQTPEGAISKQTLLGHIVMFPTHNSEYHLSIKELSEEIPSPPAQNMRMMSRLYGVG